MKLGFVYGVPLATAQRVRADRPGGLTRMRSRLIGQQKCLEQSPKGSGSRISILGLWQEEKSFEYGLAQGGFKSHSYIKIMNWIAQKAPSLLEKTGKITVVVQDNSPIHKSQEVRAYWKKWSEQGLFLFFLPPYCPELNEIETQWRSATSADRRLRRLVVLRTAHSKPTKLLGVSSTMNTILP